MKAALVLACAACGGSSGTLSVAFTGAPGSTLLAGAQSLRVVLTNPAQTFTVARGADGFVLDFDFGAVEATGLLEVTALDASGATVAYGETPPLPLDAVTANVLVYMGAPLSIAASPAVLAHGATGVGGAALPYGAVLLGGFDATGAPLPDLGVYNAYDHTLTAGVVMPEALGDSAVTATTDGQVYVFGGTDASGAATGQLWRFDTTVSPAGEWYTVDATTSFARAGEQILQTAEAAFVVTGDPALSVTTSAVAPLGTVATLPAASAVLTPADGNVVILGADGSGLVRLRAGAVDHPAGPMLDGLAVAAVPPAAFAVVGGMGNLAATRVDAATGASVQTTGALSVPRANPSVAATSRYVVVAGGTDPDGAPIESCDVLAAADLSRVATLPCPAGTALALPNDQILLVGGDQATTAISLFTPDPPPQ